VNRSLHSLSLSRLFPLSPSPSPSRSHSGHASLLSTVDHFITGFTDAQVARLNARAARGGTRRGHCTSREIRRASTKLRCRGASGCDGSVSHGVASRIKAATIADLHERSPRCARDSLAKRRCAADYSRKSRDRLSPDNKNSARSGESIIDLRTTQSQSSKSGGARVGRVLRYPRRNRQDSNQIGSNLYPIK